MATGVPNFAFFFGTSSSILRFSFFTHSSSRRDSLGDVDGGFGFFRTAARVRAVGIHGCHKRR